MKNTSALIVFILSVSIGLVQAQTIILNKSSNGHHLMVDGEPFIINGMNWDYIPIGTNYDFNLWEQPEGTIKKALESEMTLLQDMGVNVIRQYVGVPAKWVDYIYENYGIYTMLNHPYGRYGFADGDKWITNTDYANPKVKEILLKEVEEVTLQFKASKGLLLILLGNENNYGLVWEDASTENLPDEPKRMNKHARRMYQLMNEAAVLIKSIDRGHLVALCNGGDQYLKMIKRECPDIDIYGANVYRGMSFGNFFDKVRKTLDKPVLITEFGADAFNAKTKQEEQAMQATYLLSNWKEIYENTAGLSKSENSLGGFTFHWSDGWWKHGQTKDMEKHDVAASWSNGGYLFDFEHGSNNMNEEWFGICAKGSTQPDGTYDLFPRMSYHVLKEVHAINPYSERMSCDTIYEYFTSISEKWLSKGDSEHTVGKND